jgi:hypothetical protein
MPDDPYALMATSQTGQLAEQVAGVSIRAGNTTRLAPTLMAPARGRIWVDIANLVNGHVVASASCVKAPALLLACTGMARR